jgi:hypothetical protein
MEIGHAALRAEEHGFERLASAAARPTERLFGKHRQRRLARGRPAALGVHPSQQQAHVSGVGSGGFAQKALERLTERRSLEADDRRVLGRVAQQRTTRVRVLREPRIQVAREDAAAEADRVRLRISVRDVIRR